MVSALTTPADHSLTVVFPLFSRMLRVRSFSTSSPSHTDTLRIRYIDTKDARIPDIFKCYACRVNLAATESLLNPAREGEITRALTNLRGLALFRHSIMIISKDGVLPLARFAKKLGSSFPFLAM